MKKIYVIKSESYYGVLCVAADQIVVGFEKEGYDVDVIGLNELINNIESISENALFVFSCQATIFNYSFSDGRKLLDAIRCPCVGWIFDDVLMHLPRIMMSNAEGNVIFSVNGQAKDTVERMFDDKKNILFMPHGGFPPIIDTKKKDIDVLFPGNMLTKLEFEKISGREMMPVEKLFIDEAKELLKNDQDICPRTAIYKVLRQRDIELTKDLLMELSAVIVYLNKNYEQDIKNRMLLALLNHGITVNVIGDGYEEIAKEYPNLINLDGMDINDALLYFARSKIVINPLPTIFEMGYHERIFTTMLHDSVCFTPYSSFLKDNLKNRVEYVDLNDMDSFCNDVEKCISEFESRLPLLKETKNWAMNRHTWEARGKSVLTETIEYFNL